MTERMAERRTERITERTDRMRKTNRNRKQMAAVIFALSLGITACGGAEVAGTETAGTETAGEEAAGAKAAGTENSGTKAGVEGTGGFRMITDGRGRDVEIPETVERAVCVGVGALRYSCYMEAADRIVGVEDYETKPGMDRLYQYVNFERFQELPVIGANGEPYAEEIIDGGRARERQLLETVSAPEPSGNICIIGTLDACYGYADYLAAYDVRDNVSGAHLTDGLPDFAGETIVCIADAEPFTGYVASGDTLELRRQSAMRLICALDTLVHISPYDLDGFGGKAPAKLVVVADPGLCEYGMFDIDTLKAATGNHIPVVSPLDMMLDGVFGSRPGRTLSLGIIYDPEIAGEDIYRTRFRRAAAANGKMQHDNMAKTNLYMVFRFFREDADVKIVNIPETTDM